MSFFSSIQNFFTTTEKDVILVITKIKKDVVIAAGDIEKALKWLAGNSPLIDADIQEVLTIITTLGATNNPAVATAVSDANKAVVALNAFASASNAGTNSALAVVQGYVAFQQANAAVSSAKAAAAATAASKP